MKPADFAVLLKTSPRVRTVHFVLHHLPQAPSKPKLSTARLVTEHVPVDDSATGGLWLGMAVPKRYARRAVTRNLVKRQARAVMQQHAAGLERGMWLVRLRAPFDKATYLSATSPALALAIRAELTGAFSKACAPRANR